MIYKANIFSLSPFKEFDSAYWSLGVATNGIIYFALCTHIPQHNASLFSFNPQNYEIKEIFNMSAIIKTKSGFLSQGKIHTQLFEGGDKRIYFATHFAYPFGKPQIIKYEGGHWVSFDPKVCVASDLGIGIREEGIISMTMDKTRISLMFPYIFSLPVFTENICSVYRVPATPTGKVTSPVTTTKPCFFTNSCISGVKPSKFSPSALTPALTVTSKETLGFAPIRIEYSIALST